MAKKNIKMKMVVQTGLEHTLSSMPRYNPYQTGHGVWKSKKYQSRSAAKADLRRQVACL